MVKRNKKGLTLIELLAVIAIIAILFILLIPAVSSGFEKARVSGVQTDFHSYQVAAKSYYMEHLGKGKTESNFNNYLDKNLRFTNNKSKELNPWGKEYILEIVDGKLTVSTDDGKSEPKYYAVEFGYKENGEMYEKIIGFDEVVNKSADNSTENSEQEGRLLTDEEVAQKCGEERITSQADFETTEYGEGVQIEKYKGTEKNIVIPCEIYGKKVLNLKGQSVSWGEEGAFANSEINYVKFPKTLTRINDGAFYGSKIKEVTIPNYIKEVGGQAFNGAPERPLLTISRIRSRFSGVSSQPNIDCSRPG